jgi:ribonuclease VapC
MVIDSSAVLAILQDEPERATFNRAVAADRVRLLSAANYLEVAIIIDRRRGEGGARDLRHYLIDAAINIVPVSASQAELARAAYRRFGRGYHPARLNFGDCLAYALAQETGESLLFKGEDFPRTDVATV